MTTKQKQCLLLYLGYYAGEIDGIWGNNSRCATEAFQRNYGLTVDGIFGIGTEARIREVVASGEPPQQPQGTPETEGGADWWKNIRYFKRAEFRCPCGRCGGFPVEPQESIGAYRGRNPLQAGHPDFHCGRRWFRRAVRGAQRGGWWCCQLPAFVWAGGRPAQRSKSGADESRGRRCHGAHRWYRALRLGDSRGHPPRICPVERLRREYANGLGT